MNGVNRCIIKIVHCGREALGTVTYREARGFPAFHKGRKIRSVIIRPVVKPRQRVGGVGKQFLHAAFQFLGGSLGEGHQKDAPDRETFFCDEPHHDARK